MYNFFFQQLLPPLLVTTMAHSLDHHTDVTAYPQCGAISVADHMSVTAYPQSGVIPVADHTSAKPYCFGIDVSSLLVVWYSLFFTGTAVGGHSARPCFVILIIVIVGSIIIRPRVILQRESTWRLTGKTRIV